jgi:hypothetical protein
MRVGVRRVYIGLGLRKFNLYLVEGEGGDVDQLYSPV